MIAVIHRGEKFKEMLEQSNSTQEYTLLKRKKEKLQTDIITQTKNMREVDEKQSACCLSWMKTEKITWLLSMIWSRQKKGCYPLLSIQKMRSRKFWLL